MKCFQSNVNTLVGGHICSFLQVRWVTWLCASCVWLNWIDHWNFILDYGIVYTWFTHTTHNTNFQWMSISFVWLYVFKCDVCVLNHMWIKPKIFLIILFAFGSVFHHSLFLSSVLTLFFNVSSLFLCWKTGVSVFYESRSRKMHFWNFWSSGSEFRE